MPRSSGSPLAVALLTTALLAGCGFTDDPEAEGAPPGATSSQPAGHEPGDEGGHGHHHENGARISMPVGDGTQATEVGYSLTGVHLPERAGEAGQVRFTIEDYRGRPVTDYIVEQDKQMHVYVVRDDLAVFRHVHPQLQPDGTWTGNLTLPEPGDYRLVTEFVARDEGGNGDHIVLGAERSVPGAWQPVADPVAAQTPAAWVVDAEVLAPPAVGRDQTLRIRLSRDGEPVDLGQYLGTSAHLTGFHRETGAVVHMHPLGEPARTDAGTDLTFHTELPAAGDYLLFLQVRVDGFLHTIPVPATAG